MTTHTITTPDNLETIDDPAAVLAAIDDQLRPVWIARQQVQVLADGVAQSARTTQAVNDALGRAVGGAWRQPYGGHDAYPKGAQVTRNSRAWTNTVPANVWQPGVHGWTDTGPAGGTPPAPAATPWSGASVAYKVGDKVTFTGKTYSCVQAHTSQSNWTPVAVPALWTDITP